MEKYKISGRDLKKKELRIHDDDGKELEKTEAEERIERFWKQIYQTHQKKINEYWNQEEKEKNEKSREYKNKTEKKKQTKVSLEGLYKELINDRRTI